MKKKLLINFKEKKLLEKKAFTLIELLVVITIIAILAVGFANLPFNKQKDKEELNKIVNKAISKIEETSFNSLLGKAYKNNIIPEKRKIIFYSGANSFYLEKWYLSGTNWQQIEKVKLTRPGLIIKNYFCKNINDLTETGSFDGSGEIIFSGKNIYLSGGDCNQEKFQELEMDFKLKEFTKKIIFNTISGNLEKLNK